LPAKEPTPIADLQGGKHIVGDVSKALNRSAIVMEVESIAGHGTG